MQITREQRISNSASNVVNTFNQIGEQVNRLLKDGLDVKANEEQGQEALKATGDEMKKALGVNLERIKQILKLILE